MKRFWIGLFALVCFNWIIGCDIDFVTDTVYVPSPIYHIEEPCCNDYIEIWTY